eukprot:7511179-Pyramimonas_sp.AAC.1
MAYAREVRETGSSDARSVSGIPDFRRGKPMHKDPGDHIARLAQALNVTALAFSEHPSVSYDIIRNHIWLAKCP